MEKSPDSQEKTPPTEDEPNASEADGTPSPQDPEQALKTFDFGQISEESVSETQMIDFSGEENEYLSGDLLQKALAFSIISALFGFLISAWLFLGQRVGNATELLDRRQAEGRVVHTSEQAQRSYGSTGFFSPPKFKKKTRRELTRPESEWKNLAALEKKKIEKKPEKKEPVKKVAEAEVHKEPDYKTAKPKKATTRKPKLGRLLYPLVNVRPSVSDFSTVARQAEEWVVRVPTGMGDYLPGVVIDEAGHAVISGLSGARLDRVWVGSRPVPAELVARDSEFGLALIKLQGSSFQAAPLAPAPPAQGDEVLAFGLGGKDLQPTLCLAGASFGKAGFLVEGYLKPTTVGTPILNDRGELVGVHIGSLRGVPGSGIHLAADSAVLNRFLRGYRGEGGGSFAGTEAEAVSRLSSMVRSQGEDGQRGRVVPGVGLSDFTLGMSSSDARKQVSAPQVTRPGAGLELWTSPAPPVTLLFVDDRLAAAASDFTGFSTLGGLSVGANGDARTLGREFLKVHVHDSMAVTPGLDVELDSSNRIKGFVVRPKVSGS